MKPSHTLASKLRKLAADCQSCRYGHCCGQCLCCMPEEKLRTLVQDAQDEVGPPRSKGRAFHTACCFLAANGPQPADMVGAIVWKDKPRGKISSSGGGGDYAAQMLLGRMKKAGLVRHARSEGSTLWEVTALGRAEATK